MRIVVMTPFFVPNWIGGTEIATSEIARVLASRGHDVHLITSGDEGLPKESIDEGFFIHRMARKRYSFLANRLFELRMLRMLLKIHPEIVHVQTIQFGISALLAKLLFQIPYVIYVRGGDVYDDLSVPGLAFMTKILLKNASVVVVLTRDMKKRIQEVYMRDVIVIPNGIDVEKFGDLPKNEARTTLQIDGDKKIVTFVGSLLGYKGVEYLIRATKLMVETRTDVHTLIIGDGPNKDMLEHLTQQLQMSNYTTFKGRIQHEQIPYYLAASDIFVLPSLTEGFPNVLLEAMASGLPIVATDVKGVSEFITDGENGFLVEPQNAKKIAESVLSILNSEEVRERISSNNKLKARDFGWEHIVDNLETVYNSCL
jgi:glycosyltransferase involved in cell wall biosynthesis